MHGTTRERRLSQPLALKLGQISGQFRGPHSRHNKTGRGREGWVKEVRCSQKIQNSNKKEETEQKIIFITEQMITTLFNCIQL